MGFCVYFAKLLRFEANATNCEIDFLLDDQSDGKVALLLLAVAVIFTNLRTDDRCVMSCTADPFFVGIPSSLHWEENNRHVCWIRDRTQNDERRKLGHAIDAASCQRKVTSPEKETPLH